MSKASEKKLVRDGQPSVRSFQQKNLPEAKQAQRGARR
jgi:hypothetical protein